MILSITRFLPFYFDLIFDFVDNQHDYTTEVDIQPKGHEKYIFSESFKHNSIKSEKLFAIM